MEPRDEDRPYHDRPGVTRCAKRQVCLARNDMIFHDAAAIRRKMAWPRDKTTGIHLGTVATSKLNGPVHPCLPPRPPPRPTTHCFSLRHHSTSFDFLHHKHNNHRSSAACCPCRNNNTKRSQTGADTERLLLPPRKRKWRDLQLHVRRGLCPDPTDTQQMRASEWPGRGTAAALLAALLAAAAAAIIISPRPSLFFLSLTINTHGNLLFHSSHRHASNIPTTTNTKTKTYTAVRVRQRLPRKDHNCKVDGRPVPLLLR